MAYKSFGTNDPETIKLWSNMVDKRFATGTAFKDGDCSTDPGSALILTKTDLSKANDKGDRIRVIGVDAFEGKGTLGDRNIVGLGEKIRTNVVDVSIDMVRHEAESAGAMSEKRTVIDFRKVARNGLSTWMAKKIDGLRLACLSGELGVNSYNRIRWGQDEIADYLGIKLVAPDSEHHLFAGSATQVSELTNTDLPTADLLSRIKRYNADLDKPLMPHDVNGNEKLVLWVDEAVLQQLKKDDKFRNTFLYAAPRDKSNALYTGNFEGEYDGLLIKKLPQLIKPAGATTPGAVRRMLLTGVDDLYEAWGKGEYAYDGKFEWYEDTANRGKNKSITVGAMYGIVKNTWLEGGVTKWRNSMAIDVWVGASA